MSRLLGVSRNAYYRYCQRQRKRLPDAEHEAMIEAVKEVAQSSDKSYGSRRIKHALNALGYPVGRRKARSLMREAGVKARYRKKFKVTTNSDHKQPVFDNVLARNFTAAEPDQAYVGDIPGRPGTGNGDCCILHPAPKTSACIGSAPVL